MKKLILASTILASSLVGSLASDLPARTAPPPPAPLPVFGWTGWRVSATAGVDLGRSATSFAYPESNWTNGRYTPPFNSGYTAFPMTELLNAGLDFGATGIWPSTHSGADRFPVGVAAGLQIGYVYQLSGNNVVGVELGLYGSSKNSKINWSDAGFYSVDDPLPIRDDWTQGLASKNAVTTLALLKFKAGRAYENIAIYLTGGPAFGLAKSRLTANSVHSAAVPGPGCIICHADLSSSWGGSAKKWRAGFNVGASVEVPLSERVFLKADYSYYRLQKLKTYADGLSSFSDTTPDQTNVLASGSAPQIASTMRPSGHLFQIGIGYQFGK